MTIDELERELWFRCFDPLPHSRVRLVCLPHAGGAAPFYRPLSTALFPDVETLCVQYPGRQDRRNETIVTDLRELADRIASRLASYTDKPLALFGHSMGAVLGYEVALRLEHDHGLVITELFASGRRAPSAYRRERVHLLDDKGLIAAIRELSGTDERVLGDEEILQLVLPSIRGDYKAIETYEFIAGQAPISSPITVLLGDSDPQVTPEEAHAWLEHTRKGFDLQTFPGGHFYVNECWDQIADKIRRTLLP